MWYIFGTHWIKKSNDLAAERVYKIGYAWSEDNIIWNKYGKRIIEDTLNPDECQALPTVIEYNNKYHMYFCYRQTTDFRKNKDRSYRIGYAFSDDMVNWTRDDKNAGIYISDDGWDSDMQCYPHVFKCEENFYMLYNGNEFGRFGFGLAVLE